MTPGKDKRIYVIGHIEMTRETAGLICIKLLKGSTITCGLVSDEGDVPRMIVHSVFMFTFRDYDHHMPFYYELYRPIRRVFKSVVRFSISFVVDPWSVLSKYFGKVNLFLEMVEMELMWMNPTYSLVN